MSLTVLGLKIYVPAKDLEVSKAFYRAMGFEVTEAWGGDYDCSLGGTIFRLQDYYVKEWADNFMLQFEVDDVTVWHDHAKSVIDTGKYGDARMGNTEIIGDTTIVHVVDPSGVLLLFIH
ncbi:MAG: glyoxalase [Acidobacteriota bacterium]